MTFKALHTGRPPYLSDLLQHHEPTRSLRSSSSHQLLVPATNQHLDLVLFDFLLQEFGIHYLSVFMKLSHFALSDVIKRHFIFSQPTRFQLPILPRISSSTRPYSSKDLGAI